MKYHSYPNLPKLYFVVSIFRLIYPMVLTRVTYRPSPKASTFSGSLYSAIHPSRYPINPERTDWGSGWKTLIFRFWIPADEGKWTLPYPRTNDLPKKSVPYRITIIWGHPARKVVSNEISKGMFQMIFFPFDEAIWLNAYFCPETLCQSGPWEIE